MRFDRDVPPPAIANVLRSVASQVPPDALDALCLHAYALHGDDVARDLAWAIQRGGEVGREVAELVETLAGHSDPTGELARTPAEGFDGQTYDGGDLASAGLNCVRGSVAIAVGALLRTSDEHLDLLAPTIADLAQDPILAVRVSAAEAVGALTLYETDLALDLTESLFDTVDDVLDARSTERLLRWAVIRDPERFASVLHRAVDGPAPIATRGGRVWAVAEYHGALRDPLPQTVEDLPVAARAGAAEMFASNAGDSVEQLEGLFSDSSAEVREQAARVWRNLDASDVEVLDRLAVTDISSPALLDDELDGLVRVYAGLPGRLPDTALDVCDRVIGAAGSELGDLRTARSAVSRDLIALILRFYRQSNGDGRRRCLDLIDRLVDFNAYDVDAVLANER